MASAQPDDSRVDLRPWQAKLEAARQSQYSDLKASADKWAGTLAVLIGAVGSISVIVVPKALSDFSNGKLETAVFWLAVAAGGLGLMALGAATYVSQGWPKIDDTMDAGRFRLDTINKTASAVTWLSVSRVTTLIALVCVIAASVISQADTLTAPATPVNVLVVHQDGSATCGPVAGAETAKSVTSVTVVSSC